LLVIFHSTGVMSVHSKRPRKFIKLLKSHKKVSFVRSEKSLVKSIKWDLSVCNIVWLKYKIFKLMLDVCLFFRSNESYTTIADLFQTDSSVIGKCTDKTPNAQFMKSSDESTRLSIPEIKRKRTFPMVSSRVIEKRKAHQKWFMESYMSRMGQHKRNRRLRTEIKNILMMVVSLCIIVASLIAAPIYLEKSGHKKVATNVSLIC